MKRALSWGWLVLCVPMGCTSVGKSTLRSDLERREPECELHGYQAPSDVPVAFEGVCDLNARVSNLPWAEAERTTALNNARPMLCECGADAFIYGSWQKHAIFLQASMRIMGIRYKENAPEASKQVHTFEQIRDALECEDLGGVFRDNRCSVSKKQETYRRRGG